MFNNDDVVGKSVYIIMLALTYILILETSLFVSLNWDHDLVWICSHDALNKKVCKPVAGESYLLTSLIKSISLLLPARDVPFIYLIYKFLNLFADFSHWCRNILFFFSLLLRLTLLLLYSVQIRLILLDFWLRISLLTSAWFFEFRFCSSDPLSHNSVIVFMTSANTKIFVTSCSRAIWDDLIEDEFSRVIWTKSTSCGNLPTISRVGEILFYGNHCI